MSTWADQMDAENLRITQDLIDLEGVDVVLLRPAPRVRTVSGGLARAAGGLTPQPAVKRWVSYKSPVRFAPGRTEMVPTIRTHIEGMQLAHMVSLVGLPGDDMKALDQFDWNGERYIIREVFQQPFQVFGDCETVKAAE